VKLCLNKVLRCGTLSQTLDFATARRPSTVDRPTPVYHTDVHARVPRNGRETSRREDFSASAKSVTDALRNIMSRNLILNLVHFSIKMDF